MTIRIEDLIATFERLPSPKAPGETIEIPVLERYGACALPYGAGYSRMEPVKTATVRAGVYRMAGRTPWLEWELVRVNGLDA